MGKEEQGTDGLMSHLEVAINQIFNLPLEYFFTNPGYNLQENIQGIKTFHPVLVGVVP